MKKVTIFEIIYTWKKGSLATDFTFDKNTWIQNSEGKTKYQIYRGNWKIDMGGMRADNLF